MSINEREWRETLKPGDVVAVIASGYAVAEAKIAKATKLYVEVAGNRYSRKYGHRTDSSPYRTTGRISRPERQP